MRRSSASSQSNPARPAASVATSRATRTWAGSSGITMRSSEQPDSGGPALRGGSGHRVPPLISSCSFMSLDLLCSFCSLRSGGNVPSSVSPIPRASTCGLRPGRVSNHHITISPKLSSEEELAMSGPETRPNAETRDAERDEAAAPHQPDRAPTRPKRKRPRRTRSTPRRAEHFEEMAERGAKQKGEGRFPDPIATSRGCTARRRVAISSAVPFGVIDRGEPRRPSVHRVSPRTPGHARLPPARPARGRRPRESRRAHVRRDRRPAHRCRRALQRRHAPRRRGPRLAALHARRRHGWRSPGHGPAAAAGHEDARSELSKTIVAAVADEHEFGRDGEGLRFRLVKHLRR